MVLTDVAGHAVHVLAQLVVENVYLGTGCQRIEQVEGGGVEREAGMVEVLLRGIQTEGLDVPCGTGTDAGLTDDHALGLASRAGSVNHVTGRSWCGQALE